MKLRHNLWPSYIVSLLKKQAILPKPQPINPSSKKVFVILLVALCASPASVNANIFDPLLKILLPFYKSEKAPTQVQEEDTINQDVIVGDDDEEPEQFIDDGSEDAYYTPMDEYRLIDDLPSVLLDDSLTADDVIPVIDEPDLYELLSAEFSADRGNALKALTLYKAESFKKNATAVFERALALSIEFEDPKESLAFASAWQARNPDHIPAWFYVAHLALKANDYQQAAKTLSMILAYDPSADLTQILRGIFPTNPADQRALFTALQDVSDDNASISVLRAGLLMRLGDYEPALLHINKALTKEPENMAFINLKIDILRASGQTQALWQFVHDKQKAMPKEKELYLYEIRQLIENGELPNAWQLLLVANEQTHDPEVTILTALVGLDIGEYLKSAEILTPLTKNPDFASRANYYLGIGYERSGDIERARHFYERVSDYEHVLDARTKVVGFYLVDNEVEKAMSTLVRLRDDYPIYATDSYILQAEILIRQGNKQAAQNLLTSANRENPDDDRLLFASFKLLENTLSDEDKRGIIDKLLQMDVYNVEYQLADAKLRLTQNPEDLEALQTATDISQLDINDPDYDSSLQLEALMVLANQALVKKDFETVIDYLQTPYEVAPDLNVGIMLLHAYQGLHQGDKVNRLLKELQNRFAFGQNKVGAEAQQY